jgi:hypothetical protein
MTKGEELLMKEFLREAVAAALASELGPVKREIADLKAVDRKHSGVHTGLAANVRESQSAIKAAESNIKAEVGGTVDALARRDQQIIEAFDELSTLVKTSHVPATAAAGDAKTQATVAATEARSVGIDVGLMKKDAAKAVAWWRHPAFVFLVYVVLDWLSKNIERLAHG